MSQDYIDVACDCGATRLRVRGEPIVHAYCHCSDCRDLLDVPFHTVAAWQRDQVEIDESAAWQLRQHPTLSMARAFCRECGMTVYNTNAPGWIVLSQWVLSKAMDGEVPARLRPNKHFFYAQRVVDMRDDLPKYLRGVDGPLHQEGA